MENDSHDTLFYLSRATIIIPLFIIFFALFFLVNKKASTQSQINNSSPTIVPEKASFDLSKIDLKGPLTCSYASEKVILQGVIENKKIFAQISEQKQLSYYLLNGDCLYSWKQGVPMGQKSCGLATYLSSFDLIKSFPISIPVDPTMANGLLDSCIKKTIVDKNVFIIPKNIQFKEAPLEVPGFLK